MERVCNPQSGVFLFIEQHSIVPHPLTAERAVVSDDVVIVFVCRQFCQRINGVIENNDLFRGFSVGQSYVVYAHLCGACGSESDTKCAGTVLKGKHACRQSPTVRQISGIVYFYP